MIEYIGIVGIPSFILVTLIYLLIIEFKNKK
jgi:hypothetical protein